MKRKMFPTELDPPLVPIYRVSQKKLGLVFRGHLRPLNGGKSIKARK